MTAKTGVQRVTSVLTDQVPKLNQLCDDVAAQAGASVMRAAKVVSDLSNQFSQLDAAVGELEGLLAQATNNPPTDAGDVPTEPNPNMPPLGVILGGRDSGAS